MIAGWSRQSTYGGGGSGHNRGALGTGSSNLARDAANSNTGTGAHVLAELLDGVGISITRAVLVGAVPNAIDESGVGAEAGNVVGGAAQSVGRTQHVGDADNLKARSAAGELSKPCVRRCRGYQEAWYCCCRREREFRRAKGQALTPHWGKPSGRATWAAAMAEAPRRMEAVFILNDVGDARMSVYES